MIRHPAPSFGQTIFPTPTGGVKRSHQIGITPMINCIQCGFVNDTRRTAWSRKGDGLSLLIGGEPGEQIVRSGCAFCGSLFWQTHKPAKIPLDRFRPDPRRRRRRGRRAYIGTRRW